MQHLLPDVRNSVLNLLGDHAFLFFFLKKGAKKIDLIKELIYIWSKQHQTKVFQSHD